MAGGFWSGKRVTVTGGWGFLGGHVVSALAVRGASPVFIPRSRDYDLSREADARRLFEQHPADLVIHLAAKAGGIGYNMRHPGLCLYENAVMGALVMQQARLSGVAKFVSVGSATAYPQDAPAPLKEDDLWRGPLAAAHFAPGVAKLFLLALAQSFRAEHGFNAITLILVNLYGPGDRFDLENARVVPALIRKCLEAREAGQKAVALWGTGRPTRDLLYVGEAAEAILLAAERYSGPEPANVGSGREISIADLARAIARLTGFAGEFRFDPSRPDGQLRQFAHTSRARQAFGFCSRLSLEEGLKRTIDWYLANRAPPAH